MEAYNEVQKLTVQILLTMMISDLAAKTHISEDKILTDFMRSETASMLFDKSTRLWECGPDYLAAQYEKELSSYTKL